MPRKHEQIGQATKQTAPGSLRRLFACDGAIRGSTLPHDFGSVHGALAIGRTPEQIDHEVLGLELPLAEPSDQEVVEPITDVMSLLERRTILAELELDPDVGDVHVPVAVVVAHDLDALDRSGRIESQLFGVLDEERRQRSGEVTLNVK